MHPKIIPKNVRKSMKNRRKSIENLFEINAEMMLGFKIAFWTYLVRLGSHLGTNKFGKGGQLVLGAEQPTETGRWGGVGEG
jgi:hypothetical protein